MTMISSYALMNICWHYKTTKQLVTLGVSAKERPRHEIAECVIGPDLSALAQLYKVWRFLQGMSVWKGGKEASPTSALSLLGSHFHINPIYPE